MAYARKATDLGVLDLVVFEEAHVIVKDVGWRQNMRSLCKLSGHWSREALLVDNLATRYSEMTRGPV